MSHSRKRLRSKSTKGNSSTSTMNTASNNSDEILKKLENLHTRAKQEQRSAAQNSSSNMKVLGVVIIIVVGMSGIVLMNQFHLLNSTTPSIGGNPSIESQGNQTIVQSYGGFLKDTASQPLISNGKVFIVFASAEYCPYCAMERWAIVMALSQYGSFTGLTNIVTPNNEGAIPSYTFYQSSYTSQKVSFEPVELESLNKTKLQAADQIQQILLAQYDAKGTIPFLCIGGTTFMSGSGPSLNGNDFSGKTFSYVKHQVETKSGTLYNEIKTESNYIVQVINSYLALPTTTASTTVSTTTNTTAFR